MCILLIITGGLFLLNLGILGLVLCRLAFSENKTTNAMRFENHSRKKFNQGIPPDPLETIKNLQWNLVYYAILLYGALYVISGLRLFNESLYKIILVVAVLAVFDFGIYLVLELQYKMQQIRIVRMRYESAFRIDHYWMTDDEIENQKRKECKFWRDARISILLVVVQISALIVFLYSLFDKLIFVE